MLLRSRQGAFVNGKRAASKAAPGGSSPSAPACIRNWNRFPQSYSEPASLHKSVGKPNRNNVVHLSLSKGEIMYCTHILKASYNT